MSGAGASSLGVGIGWRPELALMIDRCEALGFVEILAENFFFASPGLPAPLQLLRERGVRVIPHGVSLSLGSAEPPDRSRLQALARLARACDAPLVSEHLAFTRHGGVESGHLLPLPCTREALDVVVRNVRAAEAMLPVPLALENVAALFQWPQAEMSEADFVAEVIERTGALLLLDVENLYANGVNHGVDPQSYLDRLPLSQLAYVHVAGGKFDAAGFYHDTHASPVPAPVWALLEALSRRAALPGVMIERDDDFPSDAELLLELQAIARLAKEPVS
jgi:uncharacterized protein (UPF0276 family)